MARRLVKNIRVGSCAVKIYRDSYAGEYVVQEVVGGKVTGGRDGGYFTPDKSDARSTAAHIARSFRKAPGCRR